MKSLTIEEFGDALLRTEDLDPTYVAISRTNMSSVTRAQLLISYWCFYHLGAAAHLAERPAKQFWSWMMEAARNDAHPDIKPGERWPRSAERRHFRGAQATQAVAALAARYPRGAEQALEGFVGKFPFTFQSVSDSVQSHLGFGQWIAFKVADMSERVLWLGTDFSDCELGIYKDPRQGAALAWYEWKKGTGHNAVPWAYPITDSELKMVVAHYVAYWRKKRTLAPPNRDRLVNVQEIETIFCKYKSYRKGHYHVGKDIHEVHEGLEGWGNLAEQLQQGLP